MSARKYGWQVAHGGQWMTARGVGTWESWRAQAERMGDRRVRATLVRKGVSAVAWEGPANEMPEAEPKPV